MTARDRLLTFTLVGSIADISTAGQEYIAIPDGFGGDVVEIRSVIHGAIATADATLTPKIGGTAMTNGAITVAFSGSAAGDVDVSRPSGANTVRPGEAIEIETDGASTNAVKVTITFVIRQ